MCVREDYVFVMTSCVREGSAPESRVTLTSTHCCARPNYYVDGLVHFGWVITNATRCFIPITSCHGKSGACAVPRRKVTANEYFIDSRHIHFLENQQNTECSAKSVSFLGMVSACFNPSISAVRRAVRSSYVSSDPRFQIRQLLAKRNS